MYLPIHHSCLLWFLLHIVPHIPSVNLLPSAPTYIRSVVYPNSYLAVNPSSSKLYANTTIGTPLTLIKYSDNWYRIFNPTTSLYASADNYGASDVIVNRASASTWETFYFSNATQNAYNIMSYINQKLLCLTSTNTLVASGSITTNLTSPSCMFTILQPLNTTIPPLSIVRTKSGVYLTQTPVLRSVLTLPTEQVPPEVFAVVFTNEKFSLQATTTGLYVTSYESIATCNRYIAQSYELFTPVQVGNYVALLTASGYYLTLNVSDNTFSAASFADPGSLFMFSSPTPINCSVKPGPLIMTNGSYTMKHNQTSSYMNYNSVGGLNLLTSGAIFNMTTFPGGLSQIKVSQYWVCAEAAGRLPLVANRRRYLLWEQWKFTTFDNGLVALTAQVNLGTVGSALIANFSSAFGNQTAAGDGKLCVDPNVLWKPQLQTVPVLNVTAPWAAGNDTNDAVAASAIYPMSTFVTTTATTTPINTTSQGSSIISTSQVISTTISPTTNSPSTSQNINTIASTVMNTTSIPMTTKTSASIGSNTSSILTSSFSPALITSMGSDTITYTASSSSISTTTSSSSAMTGAMNGLSSSTSSSSSLKSIAVSNTQSTTLSSIWPSTSTSSDRASTSVTISSPIISSSTSSSLAAIGISYTSADSLPSTSDISLTSSTSSISSSITSLTLPPNSTFMTTTLAQTSEYPSDMVSTSTTHPTSAGSAPLLTSSSSFTTPLPSSQTSSIDNTTVSPAPSNVTFSSSASSTYLQASSTTSLVNFTITQSMPSETIISSTTAYTTFSSTTQATSIPTSSVQQEASTLSANSSVSSSSILANLTMSSALMTPSTMEISSRASSDLTTTSSYQVTDAVTMATSSASEDFTSTLTSIATSITPQSATASSLSSWSRTDLLANNASANTQLSSQSSMDSASVSTIDGTTYVEFTTTYTSASQTIQTSSYSSEHSISDSIALSPSLNIPATSSLTDTSTGLSRIVLSTSREGSTSVIEPQSSFFQITSPPMTTTPTDTESRAITSTIPSVSDNVDSQSVVRSSENTPINTHSETSMLSTFLSSNINSPSAALLSTTPTTSTISDVSQNPSTSSESSVVGVPTTLTSTSSSDAIEPSSAQFTSTSMSPNGVADSTAPKDASPISASHSLPSEGNTESSISKSSPDGTSSSEAPSTLSDSVLNTTQLLLSSTSSVVSVDTTEAATSFLNTTTGKAILGAGAGVVVILMIIGWWLYVLRRRRKQHAAKDRLKEFERAADRIYGQGSQSLYAAYSASSDLHSASNLSGAGTRAESRVSVQTQELANGISGSLDAFERTVVTPRTAANIKAQPFS